MKKENILLVSLLSLTIAIQAWLMLVVIGSFFIPGSNLAQSVYPEWQFLIRPEREALYFHAFVVIALISVCAHLLYFKNRSDQDCFRLDVFSRLVIEGVCAFLMTCSYFKQVVYAPRPGLARCAFLILTFIAIAIKIWWPEIKIMLRSCTNALLKNVIVPSLKTDVLIIFGIFVLLFIPDVEGIVARMFVGEQFHHIDGTVAMTGWTYVSGGTLNQDVISQYGIGLPILVAQLSKLFGGFSYEHMVMSMMWISIVYFIAIYLLLRFWLNNFWVSLAGALFAIKIQMFHPLAYPIILTYPSGTVLRYCWDIFFFLCVFGHIRSGHSWMLILAGAFAGLALFHMTTTGMCLALTFYAYAFVLILIPGLRQRFLANHQDKFIWIGALLAPLVTAFVLFYWSQGGHLFEPRFYHNMGEFNNYFLSDFGTLPISDNLKDHNYMGTLMALVIPAVYILSMAVVFGIIFSGTSAPFWLMAGVVSLYGGATYHYFMARSMASNAYGIAVPFALLVSFWITVVLSRLKAEFRNGIGICLAVLSVWALLSNYLFIDYPNVINYSRNPMLDPLVTNTLPDGRGYFNHLFNQLPLEGRLPLNSLDQTDERLPHESDFATDEQLKRYYRDEFNFSEDAKMIDDLVPLNAPAAVISSFETKILMQSNRKPFFYYGPIVISRLMRMRTFVVTALYTTGHLQKTCAEIDARKPEYIFIERIFSKENIDKATYQDGSAFLELMRFVHSRYAPYKQGHYLMALKRKT